MLSKEYVSVTRINSSLDKVNLGLSLDLKKVIDCKNDKYTRVVKEKLERLKKEDFNRVKIPDFEWTVNGNIITLDVEFIKGYYSPTTKEETNILYEDIVLHDSDWTFKEYALTNYLRENGTNQIYAIDFLGYCYIPDRKIRIQSWNDQKKRELNMLLETYRNLKDEKMKIIFKIIEYLPETEQIVVKFARQNSVKPIDDYSPTAIDCSKIDDIDSKNLIESLCNLGKDVVDQQDKEDLILEQNRCDSIESTSFDDYVGKVCGAESLLLGKVESRRLKRIDIE
tara:strand:- start:1544 stop:2389 length:846 start_codon:yes stop_codon:yes gene_type:complete